MWQKSQKKTGGGTCRAQVQGIGKTKIPAKKDKTRQGRLAAGKPRYLSLLLRKKKSKNRGRWGPKGFKPETGAPKKKNGKRRHLGKGPAEETKESYLVETPSP